jgi:hypothetical protein
MASSGNIMAKRYASGENGYSMPGGCRQGPLCGSASANCRALSAQAVLGGTASLKTLAQDEPTCLSSGPVVYFRP